MAKSIAPPLELDEPIAWVTETYDINSQTESRVIRQGMSRERMIAHFPPPSRGGAGLDFDRKGLIKAVIYEAYQEVVNDGIERDRGNIRSFWYERIMHTLIKVMGEQGDEKNIKSIDSSINAAWEELVEGGYVTYKRLNLYSEKERGYKIEVVEDSPYPTTIVVVQFCLTGWSKQPCRRFGLSRSTTANRHRPLPRLFGGLILRLRPGRLDDSA
jgi:hypothetical protein